MSQIQIIDSPTYYIVVALSMKIMATMDIQNISLEKVH
jgi:hypothetical protein